MMSIQQHIHLVVTRIGRFVGNVISPIANVLYLSLGNPRRPVDLNFNLFSPKSLVGSPLIDRANGEVEDFDESVSGPSAGLDVDVIGGALDRLAVEGDADVVATGVVGLVCAVVGAVAVIDNVAGDGAGGSHDLYFERVASFGHVLSVFVFGLDGELGREGVEVAGVETGTVGERLGGICAGIDGDGLGRILNVVKVERVGRVACNDGNVVGSRIGGLVLDVPGTIPVVSDFWFNEIEVGILDDYIEEIAAGRLGSTIGVDGMDGEVLRVGGLVTILESRTIGPALVWAGKLR